MGIAIKRTINTQNGIMQVLKLNNTVWFNHLNNHHGFKVEQSPLPPVISKPLTDELL